MSGRIVIKLGGGIVDDQEALADVAEEVKLLQAKGFKVAVVHGGGARLTALARRLGIASPVVNGRRVTDPPMLEAAKMAFAGSVGTDLAAAFRARGVEAVALSGVSGKLLTARRRPPRLERDVETGETRVVDFGLVGDIVQVEPAVIETLTEGGFVPLIASLAGDEYGGVYNVNADTIAAAVAASLPASRLILLTDVDGVRARREDPLSRIERLTGESLDELCRSGAVQGGMLAKLQALAPCLERGVTVHIASWAEASRLGATLQSGAPDFGTLIA